MFTKRITEYISDDSYRAFQEVLVSNPHSGKVIKNCDGARKIRWMLDGRGKSGSIRVIYVYKPLSQVFYMLYAYDKDMQADLTDEQKKVLLEVIRELI